MNNGIVEEWKNVKVQMSKEAQNPNDQREGLECWNIGIMVGAPQHSIIPFFLPLSFELLILTLTFPLFGLWILAFDILFVGTMECWNGGILGSPPPFRHSKFSSFWPLDFDI